MLHQTIQKNMRYKKSVLTLLLTIILVSYRGLVYFSLKILETIYTNI